MSQKGLIKALLIQTFFGIFTITVSTQKSRKFPYISAFSALHFTPFLCASCLSYHVFLFFKSSSASPPDPSAPEIKIPSFDLASELPPLYPFLSPGQWPSPRSAKSKALSTSPPFWFHQAWNSWPPHAWTQLHFPYLSLAIQFTPNNWLPSKPPFLQPSPYSFTWQIAPSLCPNPTP